MGCAVPSRAKCPSLVLTRRWRQIQLLGQHQAENAGVAATLARQVANIDTGDIAAGLRQTTLPDRFEILDSDPMAVIDGSHNPGAMMTLASVLDRFKYDDLHLVIGAMSDKDHESMVEELPPVGTAFVTKPELDRAEELDTLAAAFDGNAAEVARVPSVPEATERAFSAAEPRLCSRHWVAPCRCGGSRPLDPTAGALSRLSRAWQGRFAWRWGVPRHGQGRTQPPPADGLPPARLGRTSRPTARRRRRRLLPVDSRRARDVRRGR